MDSHKIHIVENSESITKTPKKKQVKINQTPKKKQVKINQTPKKPIEENINDIDTQTVGA